jgi:hypothetical protein
MADGPVAVLPLPLYLPNLPRETVRLDFTKHYTAIGTLEKATELIETLTSKRASLNDTLLPTPETSAATEVDDPEGLVNDYVSLLSGMILSTKKTLTADGDEDSASISNHSGVPLSRGIAFTWTNFTLQENNISFGATEFEICSTVMNLGLWYLRLAKELTMSRGHLLLPLLPLFLLLLFPSSPFSFSLFPRVHVSFSFSFFLSFPFLFFC